MFARGLMSIFGTSFQTGVATRYPQINGAHWTLDMNSCQFGGRSKLIRAAGQRSSLVRICTQIFGAFSLEPALILQLVGSLRITREGYWQVLTFIPSTQTKQGSSALR